MEPRVVVGIALIVVGLMDVLFATLLLGRLVPDARARRLMQATLLGGGALLMFVGAAIALGVGGFLVG